MEQKIKFERGDSVKFGKEWCKENHSKHLIGKTVMMTPQWFEYDNGLYCEEQECPGMLEEGSDEPESVYHLFGNEFENFMDCELVKGSESDKVAYQKIITDAQEVEAKAWEKFTAEEHDFSHIEG
ncbi:hypothetical protein GK047_07905 [Paenibacillus sp. SYP-B3998]|uniref:Uncharacterized protein n=1 Tax=Paenibacillus sp. SYP-B3998 TaxID=2678564 RepID=A0A6G3ZUW3_9BACL|nr:hypothetical protein [Paenibacillus sp. SYP-B3998]NEW05932.1 hypothetical protein [Paenibacillus sp. SYP-B3998]